MSEACVILNYKVHHNHHPLLSSMPNPRSNPYDAKLSTSVTHVINLWIVRNVGPFIITIVKPVLIRSLQICRSHRPSIQDIHVRIGTDSFTAEGLACCIHPTRRFVYRDRRIHRDAPVLSVEAEKIESLPARIVVAEFVAVRIVHTVLFVASGSETHDLILG